MSAASELSRLSGLSVSEYRELFVDRFMSLADETVNFEWKSHLHGSEQFVVDQLGLYGLDDDAERLALLDGVSVEFLYTYPTTNGYSYGSCDSNLCLVGAAATLAAPWIRLVSGSVRQGTKNLVASFAQKTYREAFSAGGKFAGMTVDDLAGALRSGDLHPFDVPIEAITRDGNALILNTRSSEALIRAGVPRSDWLFVDMTGSAAAEARLTAQLLRNSLDSLGYPNPMSSG